MTKKWWWPFRSKDSLAESQFLQMLHEASVRTDDLRQAADHMKAERLKRLQDARKSLPSVNET